MPFDKKPDVALVAAPVRYDAVLKALGLIESAVREKLAGSSRIVIKPDFSFSPKGLCTSADAVRAVLDFIMEFTNKRITIAEGLFGGKEAQPAFHDAGLHELATDYGLKFVDLNRDEFIAMKLGRDNLSVARGSRLSVRLAKMILNSDFRISVAVPKLMGNRFSASSANLALGSVISAGGRDNGKARLLGSKGYPQEAAEILEVVRPSLAVIDGFNSEVNKRANETNFAVASADAVAADVVAMAALGKRLKKKLPRQESLEALRKAGLGQSSLAMIKML